MATKVIETEPYRELAEHSTGASFRTLARQLGKSREFWRTKCARDADRLVASCEEHLRGGRRLLFQIPPREDLEDWQLSLALAQHALDALKRRGWRVRARGVRIAGANPAGVGIEVYIEQEEQEQ